MKDEKYYIFNIYTSFTDLLKELPIDLSIDLKKELKQFGKLFKVAHSIENSETTKEFIDTYLNSASKKEEMLRLFLSINSFIEKSDKATPGQLEKLYDIKLTLIESIEHSASVPSPYQTKWLRLLDEARNEKSGVKER